HRCRPGPGRAHLTGPVIWIGIAVAISAWLIGLLLELGPAVHLLLLVATGLLLVQVRRDRGAAES
ncbi:MAG: hypothetical protein ACRDFR_04200, partial [Candidatus Limnocylindria bacterium]